MKPRDREHSWAEDSALAPFFSLGQFVIVAEECVVIDVAAEDGRNDRNLPSSKYNGALAEKDTRQAAISEDVRRAKRPFQWPHRQCRLAVWALSLSQAPLGTSLFLGTLI